MRPEPRLPDPGQREERPAIRLPRRLRRWLLSPEERAHLAAFDRGIPVEVTGRPKIVVSTQPPQTWATFSTGAQLTEADVERIATRVRLELAKQQRPRRKAIP